MSKFNPKKGQRVLLEARYDPDVMSNAHGCFGGTTEMVCHPHPGVDVAALLEELEKLTRIYDHDGNRTTMHTSQWHVERKRVLELRTAREAANAPKISDEWLRVHRDEDGTVWYRDCPRVHSGSFMKTRLFPHPDDIRPEEVEID